LKEKLEAATFEIEMPAGNNGKLYAAVTTHIVADILAKQGYEIERKRIDLPGIAIKTVGTYHAVVKLYEAQTAEIKIVVKAQGDKAEAVAEKTEASAEAKAE
jgi:large subunit ribosomal protein L9